MRLENVLKRSLQDVLETSWRCLQNVLNKSWICHEDVLKTSWRRLEDVLKTFLQDVLKTYNQDDYAGLDQDVLKTSWKLLLKTYQLGEYFHLDQGVLKTSSEDKDERGLQEVFKTFSSRRMFAGLIDSPLKKLKWTFSQCRLEHISSSTSSRLSAIVPQVPECLEWQKTRVPTEYWGFIKFLQSVQIWRNFGSLLVRINKFVRNASLIEWFSCWNC